MDNGVHGKYWGGFTPNKYKYIYLLIFTYCMYCSLTMGANIHRFIVFLDFLFNLFLFSFGRENLEQPA